MEDNKVICADCAVATVDLVQSGGIPQCETCYWNNARECVVCNVKNISVHEPEWKKVCKQCFIDKKRDCATPECPGYVPPNRPAWVKKCGRCYMVEREKTHTTCPRCPESTRLSRKKTEPMCKNCALKYLGEEVTWSKKPDGASNYNVPPSVRILRRGDNPVLQE